MIDGRPKSGWVDDCGPHPREWYSAHVHEQERPAPAIVYDHTGQPLVRERLPMGFDLRGDQNEEPDYAPR
jgi:hypothetical protein